MRGALLFLAACGVNQTPQPEPVPVLPDCVPNRDGAITADELPIALGATLAYYTGANRTIDQTLHDGAWRFAEERADDQVVEVGPVALRDQWYAASFPSGQFVVDAGTGIDGIYHQDTQALWLDGTASHAETPKTLVVYQPPLAVLRFPVTAGDSFTTTVTLTNATINGLPFNGEDDFAVTVRASGRLDLPYVRFSPALEVQTQAVRRSGTTMTSRRTTLFLFECFGEVTRAESKPDETNPDFTTAAYLRRFALGVTP
jgi:hypothetical protein